MMITPHLRGSQCLRIIILSLLLRSIDFSVMTQMNGKL